MKFFIGPFDNSGRPFLNAGTLIEATDTMDLLATMIDPPYFTMKYELSCKSLILLTFSDSPKIHTWNLTIVFCRYKYMY
jgi:hypothetical protein